MLRLIVENSEQSEPVVPVRWCVSPDILKKLKEKGARNIHVLFSIYRDGDERARSLVPLEQAMEYLNFQRSGKHTVNAIIVWNDDLKYLKKRVLARFRRNTFENDLYFNGEFDLQYLYIPNLADQTATMKINVGAEFFPKEPPEWEKSWVNLWFQYPAFDQCDFRRRRMLAYSIQPILLALWVPLVTIFRALFATTFAFGLGVRRVSFSPILHPFSENTADIYNDDLSKEKIFFFTDKLGHTRPFGFGFLFPPLWVLTVAVLVLTYKYTAVGYWAIFFAIVAATLIISVFAIGCIGYLFGVAAKATKQKKEKPKSQALRWTEYESILAQVTCSSEKDMRADIHTIRHPTLTLRFKALKAKVCRPYAA